MYDEIKNLTIDRPSPAELQEQGLGNYTKLAVVKELQKYEDTDELEKSLQAQNLLSFSVVFGEPIGFYLIKCFLETENSIDKALFVKDVQVYKSLQDRTVRLHIAKKIYDHFCTSESCHPKKELSVFDINSENGQKENMSRALEELMALDYKCNESHLGGPSSQTRGVSDIICSDNDENANSGNKNMLKKRFNPDTHKSSITATASSQPTTSSNISRTDGTLSLLTEESNIIGVHGRPIERLRKQIEEKAVPIDLFDEIVNEVVQELTLDVFPRFCMSKWYKLYIKCKSVEKSTVSVKDFQQLHILGRGAFGSVHACKKKSTGKLYAMKQLNKRRIQETESVMAVNAERNFLALMESRFVTTLKYAFMDDNTLFLIMDLMAGGDLKYHLNMDKQFSEERSRFYAAEVLLGLEHIHSKGIIYRDLKLENVLLDSRGHCKISDLGLAVKMEAGGVRGYAGTPGYTAPEVVLSLYYDTVADFFSFGVMIYRFLCGKKPFQSKRKKEVRRAEDDADKKTSELDRNVVEMDPEYGSHFSGEARCLIKGLLCKNPKRRLGTNGIKEIKEHPWFDPIDFGLLEAGYLDPPHVPSMDTVNTDGLQNMGPPLQDHKYERVKIKSHFLDSLHNFPFIANKVIQEEVVELLQKIRLQRRQSQDPTDTDTEPFDFFERGGGQRTAGSCLKRCTLM